MIYGVVFVGVSVVFVGVGVVFVLKVWVFMLLRGQGVTTQRADSFNPEPAEDTVRMEGVGARHHPECLLGVRVEILQAHGALLRHPRVAGPRLPQQTLDGIIAGGGGSSTLAVEAV